MKKISFLVAFWSFFILLFCSPAWAATYEYDTLNQLTRVTYDNGAQIVYEYDASGNRSSRLIAQSTSPRVEITDTKDPLNDLGITFPTTEVGQSSNTEKFFLRNLGASELEITQFLKSGDHPGDFEVKVKDNSGNEITADNFVIQTAKTYSIEVVFKPQDTGERPAIITFQTNDPGKTGVTLNLSGSGVVVPTVNITVTTNKGSGTTVKVDGAQYNAPYNVSWNSGSTHTLNLDSPQGEAGGQRYIFQSWSDSQPQEHSVVPTADTTYTATLKTQFKPAVTLNGTDATHTATVTFVQNGVTTIMNDIHGTWSDWCDQGTSLEFSVDTAGTPVKHTTDLRSWTVNSAFTAVINYTQSAYEVSVDCADAARYIPYNIPVVYSCLVTNQGLNPDTINLALSGIPANWQAVLSKNKPVLNSGASETITLTITPSLYAQANALAQITLTATSQGNPAKTDTVITTTTVVLPVYSPIIDGASAQSVGLKHTGIVWTWGASRLSPVQLSGLSFITSVNAGDSTNLAIDKDSKVYTWQNADSSAAVYPGLENIAAISAGGSHNAALKQDGTLLAWGANSEGQIGDGTTTQRDSPVAVSLANSVRNIAMGGSHSLALKHDGSVLAWGSNSHGQLGAGIDDPYQVLPVNVTGFSSVEAIAAGAAHSAALKNDGIVWAWGKNVSGQLGNGTETDSNTPLQVSSLTEVKAVVLGENHSLALKKDGTVWSWGDNTSGQLGNGSNVNSKLPVKVTNLRNIKAIAGGSSHSLAVCSDGTVWGWGYNTDGQLGNGATTPSNVPLKLPGFRLGFLHILYLSPSRYLVAEDLGVGSSYYVDRTYTITEVPAEVKYASWIKTGNADKTNTSDNFINFTLPRDAVVYIAYDSRATSLPTWMSGFINTGLTLKTTDVSLKLYAKFYPAGKVTLGGNLAAGAAGAATNYVVAVKEVTQPALMQYLSITKYPVAEDLGIGSQYYSDRTYTITELPAELNTATWIKTGNAEKTSTSDTFLSFNLNRDAMLYVAYDSRAASLPTWMSGFINTGLVIKTTDVQLKLYAKFQAAGRVTLGGNLAAGAAGAATNYVVVAKEAAALPLIKYVSPAKYPVADNLGVGSQYYSDRTYTITEFPTELGTASWIKTGNAEKTNTSDSFLTFTLNRDAVVYVAYDSRATSLPNWMSGFTNTGLVIKTTDVQLKIYAKFYAAGPVTLGGNLAAGAAGAATNYLVIVKEAVQSVFIKYVQPSKYPVVENLAVGSQYYTDRTYTITDLPVDLNMASWIKTGNADKTNTSENFLGFTLARDAMVYVAYDSRATSLPNWMSGFTSTGQVIKTTDVQLKIYARFCNAGNITLGGNLAAGAAGAGTNYVVIIKE